MILEMRQTLTGDDTPNMTVANSENIANSSTGFSTKSPKAHISNIVNSQFRGHFQSARTKPEFSTPIHGPEFTTLQTITFTSSGYPGVFNVIGVPGWAAVFFLVVMSSARRAIYRIISLRANAKVLGIATRRIIT